MDSTRVSEAPNPGSIPGEATNSSIMFYAYVLKSIEHDYYYKGHCENLELRLQQHNSGMTSSIKPYLPFQIAYFAQFETLQEAINREKYFKTSAGRRFLKSKLAS
jgi:putative endonuclease